MHSTPNQANRIASVFDHAVELDAGYRARYLDRECCGDGVVVDADR